MPLKPGKKNMGANIAELRKSGYPEKQAVAIAYSKAGEKYKAAKGGEVPDEDEDIEVADNETPSDNPATEDDVESIPSKDQNDDMELADNDTPKAPSTAGSQPDEAQLKDYLQKQFSKANDTSEIKDAQEEAAHANTVANIGQALETLARSNSMAHGGQGVDSGFYQSLKAQGQQGIQQAQANRQAAIQNFIQTNEMNRQVAQDVMTKGTYDQQQKAAKYINDTQDPTSQTSKNAQASFKSAFKDVPSINGMDVSDFSAADLANASKNADVVAKLDEIKQAKQMQLAYQQNNLDYQHNQKQAQVYTDASNKATTARGNPAVQQAQVGLASGEKALDILNQYPDLNKMPQQMVNLFTTEVAKVAAGGVPGEHGTQAVQAGTFQSAWNNFMQKVGNEPTGAQLAPFIAQYKNYLDGITKTNQNTIATYESQIYNGVKNRLTPEQDMQWKMDHPRAFQSGPSQGPAIGGTGQVPSSTVGSNPPSMTPNELPQDPKALVAGNVYKLRNGKFGKFNGQSFDVVGQPETNPVVSR